MEIIRSRILGYVITLEKPSSCLCCDSKKEPEILERVLDNDNGVLRYCLVLKCRECHEIFISTYLIGREEELMNIEKETITKPISPQK